MQQQFNTYEPKEFFVHTPSNIDFKRESSRSFSAVLDNKWKLNLDEQMSGMLELGVDEADVKDEILGGRFFIVDDRVVDHRMKSKLKFEHSESAVNQLMDILGMVKRTDVRTGNEGVPQLRASREAFEINPLDMAGGLMDIMIGYNWSPFDLDIHSVIEIWRQVCSNGAIAKSPIMDNRIPMMNRWQENLNTADHVVRHNFDKIVLPRLEALPEERITLADVNKLQGIIGGLQKSKHLHSKSIQALDYMTQVLDRAWVPGASRLNKNMQRFVEAPMTAFDAYNMVTEAATHHRGRDVNDHQAQAFITSLIFNADRRRSSRTELDKLVCDTNTFANPDKAFFGETCH